MEPDFVAILQKLVAEQGRKTLLNAAKCKAFLFDYTGSWRNIVAVAAGDYHTVGMKADGTVVTVGDDGQRFNRHNQMWRRALNDLAHSIGHI